MNRTLITSALPYANGYIHLGHIAGAYLTGDIYARYLRLQGQDVLYVCGSDEHGVAITIAAEKEKVTPKDIIDKYHYSNKDAFEKFGMSFDVYSRTSNEAHHQTAKEFFRDFLIKEYLIEKEEEQFFDPKANMFLPDRYVEGTCPNCGYDSARGDQCDSCGAYYEQLKLINPKSLVSGETPIVKKTTHWYMQFDKFQDFLESYIESKAGDWKDNVIQQTKSWLKQGFTERAITRDLSWGIKIDDIAELPKEKTAGKALYVWFEAVLGYISATKEYFQFKNMDEKEWEKWWKSEDTDYIAFIGKDNIVFHTLIFPAMLHARNDGFNLPKNVPANEFLNLEGQKISKSRNWSIDLKDYQSEFPQENMTSALRYALAMNFPETKDADFTWKDLQARNNNELSAIFGNFINRALQFIFKNFEGKVPQLTEKYSVLPEEINELYTQPEVKANINEADFNSLNKNDIDLLSALYNGIELVSKNYNSFRFRDAITETMNIARAANKYFNEKCVLGSQNEEIKENYWKKVLNFDIECGRELTQPELLFARIEDELIAAQTAKLGAKTEASKPAKPEVPLIEYDDFAKVQLRTAKIIEAEKVKKSKKLLKLQVDLGDEKRQIVAGIAEHYQPEELIAKVVTIVANLKPAKLMGIESQGMLLAASDSSGKLSVITPAKDDMEFGAEVR